MCTAGDPGIPVSQPSVPSTSAAASAVTNSRHVCGICQQVGQLCVIVLQYSNTSQYSLFNCYMCVTSSEKIQQTRVQTEKFSVVSCPVWAPGL